MNTTVIGGGVAGLAAAIELARGGARVRLIEQHHELGGRARTVLRDGFSLNFGPHAVYLHGALFRTMCEWGIMPRHASPDLGKRATMVRKGVRHGFVRDATSLMFSTFLGGLEKLEAVGVVSKLRDSDPGEGGDLTMGEWLDREVSAPAVRDFAQALIRVSTYCAQPALQSAESVLRQLRMANQGGVTYVDGGWQSIVGALETYARGLGVEIVCGSPAAEVTEGTVLAIPPAEVERLTGHKIDPVPGIHMACLDLCLSSLPDDAAVFALGLDQPLYLSVHSEWANVAPPGKALVHLGKYEGGTDAAADRAELEQFADLLLPGWRERVEYVRFLPNMLVSHAVTTQIPRPGADVLGMQGVYVAGDWVGPEGMLADAAIASGLRAVRALLNAKH